MSVGAELNKKRFVPEKTYLSDFYKRQNQNKKIIFSFCLEKQFLLC